MCRGILRQQGVGIAAHGDDGNFVFHQIRQEAQQFVGLPRVGDGQHHVLALDHAEVAVEHVKRVDKETRRAGGGKRGGDFRADVAALAHARHYEFSLAVEDNFYRTVEVVVKKRYEVEQRPCLVAQALRCYFCPFAHI